MAAPVERFLDVRMNYRYLNGWLFRHGRITSQVPERTPVERDERAIPGTCTS